MLNITEPFDPTQTVLYQSIEKKGIEKGLSKGLELTAKNAILEGADNFLFIKLPDCLLKKYSKLDSL